MSRRARVSPAEAGLPDGGARRRTPGLRREEVAVLAGVGASWYQWLEQGREITVSPQVLDAVARVLRLSGTERRHLYVLAGLNPPLPDSVVEDPEYMCDGLLRLLDGWMPNPAHVMDPYWNTVAYNESAALVMGFRPEIRQNCLISFFTDPVYRSRAANWEENAECVVAQYRAACSERPGDEGFEVIVGELAAESPEFAELWARNDVEPAGLLTKEYAHPVAGTLYFENSPLRVPARPDLTIVLHNPVPGTGTAERVEWLNSPEGRRGMYAVPSAS
ncbi:helix-turn-helix domain-containing protein [Streptomyces sp. AV19]|uniref:helix-turn-helix transcriptional regulator n=1 Tax=Streptomyces sp. AV19 TaxID=2793068 RepID=UPI0018FE5E49|nr:helix-turn-helix transcriptional regulator [Streptomyces sp. AV19]MBH1933170.1 helix-turn-helix domain-containing protein [Streptomyces sp. AV19]MDG4531887.1 helix-turn-helix transcriptional regulator [Streptomyces sp. AV19]